MFFKKPSARKERLDIVAKLYLAYKFFSNLFFAYPIFYQFAQQTITPLQVGIFFSVIGIVGFIAEIPTGIIADKHGRKRSGLIGTVALIVAPLIVFFGHTFPTYLAAALFYGIGRALLSGALESLVYDHKNISKTVYRRVNTLEITLGQSGILVSAAAGGILFSLHASLPFVIEAIAGSACLVLIACMREENKHDHVTPAASHRQHFIESMQHLFASSYLRTLVLMSVIFSVMLGMCIQFVNEAAMIEHGLQPEARGLLIAVAGIATLIILQFAVFRYITNDRTRIIYLTGGAVAAYTLMSFVDMPLFLLGYLLWCCLNATSAFVRVMVHDHIPSSHRSTIMSNFKALAVLVGLGASTATGLLVQHTETARAAYLFFGIVSCFVLLPCAYKLIAQMRNTADNPA